jgi:hypothetical protein
MEPKTVLNQLNLFVFAPIFFVSLVSNAISIGYIAQKFDVKKHIFIRYLNGGIRSVSVSKVRIASSKIG